MSKAKLKSVMNEKTLEEDKPILDADFDLPLIPTHSSFQELPLEMKAHIFSYLELKESQHFRVLSRSFNSAVKWDGIHLLVTNHSWRKLRKTDCYLLEATFKSFTITLDMNDQHSISFLARLKSLEFTGSVSSHNFIQIIQCCINLETLIIGEVELKGEYDMSFVLGMDEKYKLSLSKLKCLKLFCGNTEKRTPMNLTIFLLFLKKTIIESKAQLKSMEISAPHNINIMLYCGIFGDYMNTMRITMHRCFLIIRNIFVANRNSLQTVILEQIHRDRDLQNMWVRNGPITLKLWPSQLKKDLENIQLQEVDLGNLNSSSRLYTLEANFLQKVVSHQTKLIKMVNRSSYHLHWKIVWALVKLNCHTLTTIHFDYGKYSRSHSPPFKMSASLYKNCSGLVNLTLIQKERFKETYTHFPQIRLTDVNLLPKSLRSFTTSLILSLPVADLKSYKFVNFKALEKFEFFSSPWFSFDGVNLEILDVEHFMHILKSISSLRTINLMCNFDGKKDNCQTVTKELIQHIQNCTDLRFDHGDWKKSEDILNRKLKVLVLPAFRKLCE